MKNKKNEFNCIYNAVNFYCAFIIFILMVCLVFIFVIVMITENEMRYLIPGGICIVISVWSLINLIQSSRTKFILNKNTCQIRTKEKIFLKCATESIQRIIILKYGISACYIILDCKDYPYLSPVGYDFFKNHFVIRYSYRKLKNIQKFCLWCPVVNEKLTDYMKNF